MPKKSNRPSIPEFGIVAAAFACVLVVVSIPVPSDELHQAVRFFAVSIPLVIAGAFLRTLTHKTSWVRWVLRFMRILCGGIGDIGCGIGIYWVFRHVSPPAARMFLTTALVCWLTIGALDFVLTVSSNKASTAKRSTVGEHNRA